MDLFGSEGRIRTLGFWQPFASLMLCGKLETRRVKTGKKPPFLPGRYLFYSTKQPVSTGKLIEMCGLEIIESINRTLKNEPTRGLSNHALCLAYLSGFRKMQPEDEAKCFIRYAVPGEKTTYCLITERLQRIEPFVWKFGQQGIGFVPESELSKIKPL